MRILRPEEVVTFPPFREFSPEEIAEAYALSRAAFTAADLQQFTEVEEGTPFEEVIAELEEADKKGSQGSP